MASGHLLYDAGSSNSVLCDNLEQWDGVGDGREVQDRGDIYIYIYIYIHTHTYLWLIRVDV